MGAGVMALVGTYSGVTVPSFWASSSVFTASLRASSRSPDHAVVVPVSRNHSDASSRARFGATRTDVVANAINTALSNTPLVDNSIARAMQQSSVLHRFMGPQRLTCHHE